MEAAGIHAPRDHITPFDDSHALTYTQSSDNHNHTAHPDHRHNNGLISQISQLHHGAHAHAHERRGVEDDDDSLAHAPRRGLAVYQLVQDDGSESESSIPGAVVHILSRPETPPVTVSFHTYICCMFLCMYAHKHVMHT
jgi:hypothetical protein